MFHWQYIIVKSDIADHVCISNVRKVAFSAQSNNNNRINSFRQICTIRRAISLPNKDCTVEKSLQYNVVQKLPAR